MEGLISTEALLKRTDWYSPDVRDAVRNALRYVPTVDAVEVVRCKDCRYYLNSNEKCGLVDTRLRFYETDKVWAEDSFCSYGERKENVFN